MPRHGLASKCTELELSFFQLPNQAITLGTEQPEKVMTSKLSVSQENFYSGTCSDKMKFCLEVALSIWHL